MTHIKSIDAEGALGGGGGGGGGGGVDCERPSKLCCKIFSVH